MIFFLFLFFSQYELGSEAYIIARWLLIQVAHFF